MRHTTPTRRPPLTKAMWAAHAAAYRAELAVPLETLEAVAGAAIAAYLTTLAAQNETTTGAHEDPDRGTLYTVMHRPIYPEDLRRLATQIADAPAVGPRPEGLNRNDEDPQAAFRGDFAPLD
jgi:hypothetical protein